MNTSTSTVTIKPYRRILELAHTLNHRIETTDGTLNIDGIDCVHVTFNRQDYLGAQLFLADVDDIDDALEFLADVDDIDDALDAICSGKKTFFAEVIKNADAVLFNAVLHCGTRHIHNTCFLSSKHQYGLVVEFFRSTGTMRVEWLVKDQSVIQRMRENVAGIIVEDVIPLKDFLRLTD